MVEPQMTPTPLPNLRRSQGKPHSTKSNKLSIPSVGSPVTGITITVTGRRVGGGKLILEVLSTRHPFSTTIPIGRKVVPYTTSNASYPRWNLRTLGTKMGPIRLREWKVPNKLLWVCCCNQR